MFLLSYGVGRTGAYCLLHTMYHQIEREKSVSIYQIARLYNHQRPRCVSTLVRTWNRYFFFFFFYQSAWEGWLLYKLFYAGMEAGCPLRKCDCERFQKVVGSWASWVSQWQRLIPFSGWNRESVAAIDPDLQPSKKCEYCPFASAVQH